MSSPTDASASNTASLAIAPGLAADAPGTDLHDTPCRATIENEPRNFFWLVLHQVLMRLGWIFKTESIIMPYFMGMIGGGPMLRGMLMVLNRLGFSIPPALFAHCLKTMPQKRRAIIFAALGMAVPFALLSIVWGTGLWHDAEGKPTSWMPYFFLCVYGIFFAFTGIHQLATHSLQGKLVRADRRGRLFAAGVAVGSPVSVCAAWWLMPGWLALPDGGFTYLFALSAVVFALASLTMLGVKEVDDKVDEPGPSPWKRLGDAWDIIAKPGPCRGIACVALLYSATFTLFPHYQGLVTDQTRGDEAVPFAISSLMIWSVVQHTSVAVLSLIAGPFADRLGTRIVLRVLLFGSMLSPLTAIALSGLPVEQMDHWFWLVFLPLGFTPVTIKMMINYTLEMVPREEHPKFISDIGICLALPVVLGATLVGWLIEQIGCVPVFAMGTFILLLAGLQSLRLIEPRHLNRS